MDNIFELASRNKLRFAVNGNVSTEELWTAPHSTLVDYEQALNDLVESYGKSTRRTKTVRTREQELNALRLAVVTHVLNVRENEAEAAATRAADKEHNQRILELIKAKKEAALTEKTVEELEAMLIK